MNKDKYIPLKGTWFDAPKVSLHDLFPGKSIQESDRIMIEAGALMERFLEDHGQNSIGIQWMNILERDDNPDGTVGFFRLYPKS